MKNKEKIVIGDRYKAKSAWGLNAFKYMITVHPNDEATIMAVAGDIVVFKIDGYYDNAQCMKEDFLKHFTIIQMN